MKNLYYWIFLGGIAIWLLAIFSYPFLLRARSPLAPLIHFTFSFVCHQKEERCFFVYDKPLPVCSRCMGIYSGIFAGIVLFPFFKKSSPLKLIYLPLSVFPMGFEILLEKTGLGNGNLIRFISAIPFGFTLSYLNLLNIKEEKLKI
ncbi:MAG: DUF2085 domain-containing protein [Candidatus Aminicenantia bacterium]